MAVADRQILNEVQYASIEPVNLGQVMTSEIWTIAEVIGYLNQRLRRFISETKIALTYSTWPTTPTIIRYDLNNISTGMVDLVRVAWLNGATGESFELERSETMRYDFLRAGWESNPDTPQAYSISTQPNMIIDLMPAPLDVGSLALLYTALGTAMSNTGVNIPLPDDFAPYLKWGILADMLKKDGLGHDAERAAYCESRFQEGIELAKVLLGQF